MVYKERLFPQPQFGLGQRVLFDRKNNKELGYQNEGIRVGTIHTIQLTLSTISPDEIQYWTEHDDYILDSDIIRVYSDNEDKESVQ